MVIQPNSIGPPPLLHCHVAPRMYQAKSQESGLRKVFRIWLVGSRQNFKMICQSSNDFDEYDLQFWLRTTSHLGKFEEVWTLLGSEFGFFWFVSYPVCYVMNNILWITYDILRIQAISYSSLAVVNESRTKMFWNRDLVHESFTVFSRSYW